MATLIAVYNSDGCVGRCDAKCYEAREVTCRCICGGRNHGAGYQSALDNTRQHAEAWIEHAKQDGWPIESAELGQPISQPELFTDGSGGGAAEGEITRGSRVAQVPDPPGLPVIRSTKGEELRHG